jgi:uncharacterized protein (DUF2164 family)
MTITISKESVKEATASIQRYFAENMDERIGSLEAGALLAFFLQEVGPLVYNQAVAEVQEKIQASVMEVDIEVHEEEFQYWRKIDRSKKR